MDSKSIHLAYPQLRWQTDSIPLTAWPGQLLRPDSGWFCVGSCFAERSARALKQHLLAAHFAAGGALYTPDAICRWLELCRCAGESEPQDFYARHEKLVIYVASSGMYLHPHTPGWMAAASAEELLQLMYERCLLDWQFLSGSAVVLITLGSSFSFYSREQDCYWSNGHGLPNRGAAARLQKVLCAPLELALSLQKIGELLAEGNPQAQYVYSVSPLRHMGLAAVDNNLSKSQLLVALHWRRRAGQLYYFPAYEIVHDELRDYRWYDCQHKQLGLDSFGSLLERLLSVAASSELEAFLLQVVRLIKILRHRQYNDKKTAGDIPPVAAELLSQLRQSYAHLPENCHAYRELLLQNSVQELSF